MIAVRERHKVNLFFTLLKIVKKYVRNGGIAREVCLLPASCGVYFVIFVSSIDQHS